MKKSTIIGLLIIGLIFQNCKNNKTQKDVLKNNDTKSIVQPEIDTTTNIIDNLKTEEEISLTIETEDVTKPATELSKKTEKEVVKITNETIPTIKKEAVKKEIAVEEVFDKITETEKEVKKEAEIKTVTEPVIKKVEETEKANEPIIEEIKSVVSPNKWVVPAKYLTMKNPTDPKVDLAIGKSLYSKHCKSCHGSEGYGDGPKADEMKGDLGDFSTEQFQVQSDGALFYKTTFGKDDMPEYTKKIPDDEDRWLLVNFMRTLKEE